MPSPGHRWNTAAHRPRWGYPGPWRHGPRHRVRQRFCRSDQRPHRCGRVL